MKPRDGSAPNFAPGGAAGGRPRTEEFDLAEDHADDEDLDDARPRPIRDAMETAEVDLGRDRRSTLMSPIPARLAESMVPEPSQAPRRDPAAPAPERVEQTRRVGDSDRLGATAGSTPKSELGVAARRQRAGQRIDEARAAMDARDLAAALVAAEAALREADEAPPPGIVEVIEPARPFLTSIFASYVGSTSGVPILGPNADDAARKLGDRERALLRRVDGLHTLEELFDGSGLGSTDALRVVARLIRTGAVRIL